MKLQLQHSISYRLAHLMVNHYIQVLYVFTSYKTALLQLSFLWKLPVLHTSSVLVCSFSFLSPHLFCMFPFLFHYLMWYCHIISCLDFLKKYNFYSSLHLSQNKILLLSSMYVLTLRKIPQGPPCPWIEYWLLCLTRKIFSNVAMTPFFISVAPSYFPVLSLNRTNWVFFSRASCFLSPWPLLFIFRMYLTLTVEDDDWGVNTGARLTGLGTWTSILFVSFSTSVQWI